MYLGEYFSVIIKCHSIVLPIEDPTGNTSEVAQLILSTLLWMKSSQSERGLHWYKCLYDSNLTLIHMIVWRQKVHINDEGTDTLLLSTHYLWIEKLNACLSMMYLFVFYNSLLSYPNILRPLFFFQGIIRIMMVISVGNLPRMYF